MENIQGHKGDIELERLIALVTEALALSDELGLVFVGIDLSSASDRLMAIRSAEPGELSPV